MQHIITFLYFYLAFQVTSSDTKTHACGGVTHKYIFGFKIHVCQIDINTIMRGSRGGTGGPDPPPPLRFVRGGVLHGCLGRRGGPKVVFIFLYNFFFWLASLASIIHIEYSNV